MTNPAYRRSIILYVPDASANFKEQCDSDAPLRRDSSLAE
jgi:hypothetical protein